MEHGWPHYRLIEAKGMWTCGGRRRQRAVEQLKRSDRCSCRQRKESNAEREPAFRRESRDGKARRWSSEGLLRAREAGRARARARASASAKLQYHVQIPRATAGRCSAAMVVRGE